MLNLNKILEPAKTIAIGGHVRPDGDCVGSCMAMYQYIQNNYPDKEVDVFLEEIPSTFYRIKGTDEILHEIDESKHYDLFIVLDCGDTGRLGNTAKYFESAKHTYCVDHHVSNQAFAEENYIFPEASSTCELMSVVISVEEAVWLLKSSLLLESSFMPSMITSEPCLFSEASSRTTVIPLIIELLEVLTFSTVETTLSRSALMLPFKAPSDSLRCLIDIT